MGACDASPFVNVVAIAWGVWVMVTERRGAFSRPRQGPLWARSDLITATYLQIQRYIQAYIDFEHFAAGSGQGVSQSQSRAEGAEENSLNLIIRPRASLPLNARERDGCNGMGRRF
jgi:hypothetical protein